MKLPYIQASHPHAQRRINIERALCAVHLFGHIRHAELALLLWPNSSEASRAVSASRLFSWLVSERYLVRRLNSLGSYSYVLALRGAMFVGRLLPEGSREGSRISGVQGRGFFHRTLGTAWMVDQLLRGNDVYTEFAINSGRYEITRQALAQRWGKLPDGLVIREKRNARGEVTEYLVDWLEVESTHKGLKQRDRVMDMIWVLGRPLLDEDKPLFLDRLVLLYTADSHHESMMVQSAIQKWRQDGHQIDEPKALLESVILTSAVATPPLSVKSFSSIDLYAFLQRSGQLPELSKPLDPTEVKPADEY